MTAWQAALLGLVQGVFMFFPVSSTSHLVLLQHWLREIGADFPDPDSETMIFFNLLVHVGTLVSIAVVFRRPLADWWNGTLADLRALRGTAFRWHNAWSRLHLRLTLLCGLSVLVTAAIGLMMKAHLTEIFARPLFVATALCMTGVMLWGTDSVRGGASLRRFGPREAIIIGLAQAFALVPGLSRSGLTIAAALFIGMRRRWAAEYSFLLAIPTILAASLVQAVQLTSDGGWQHIGISAYAIAFVVSAASGCVALWLVIRLLYRARFRVFAIYVWLLASVVIWLRVG